MKEFFIMLTLASGMTMSDSYTTARYVGAGKPCYETGNELFIGKYPTPNQAYISGAGKIAIGSLASLTLRNTHKFHKAWLVPLMIVTAAGAEGIVNNLARCR